MEWNGKARTMRKPTEDRITRAIEPEVPAPPLAGAEPRGGAPERFSIAGNGANNGVGVGKHHQIQPGQEPEDVRRYALAESSSEAISRSGKLIRVDSAR